MSDAYVCDKCDELLRGNPAATITVDNHEDEKSHKYDACYDCMNKIMVFAAGNDD